MRSALVVGLGRSGKEAALLLRQKGVGVTVIEREKNFLTLKKAAQLRKYGVNVVFGQEEETVLKDKDVVVLSPGVPRNSSIIEKAEALSIPLISELELAWRFIPRKNLIAVTGTNGKTTTCFLFYKLLKESGFPVQIGGNVGVPLSRVARFLQDSKCKVVTEVSSFQLEESKNFAPHIYCILNITPDHLDRHSSFTEYVEIKSRPLGRMKRGDFAILNYDQPHVRALEKITKAKVVFFSQKEKLSEGVFIDKDRIVAKWGKKKVLLFLDNLYLCKFHSLDNLLCTVAFSLIEGIGFEIVGDVLFNYKPLPHRQQFIAEIEEVKFFDDSKATNQAAVENFLKCSAKPCILIMGGKDKGGDFSFLKNYSDKIKTLVVMGEAAERIKKQVEDTLQVKICKGMREAVRVAFSVAQKGDFIALSPGCASFDEFISYRHRGRVFKKEVLKLKGEIEGKKQI